MSVSFLNAAFAGAPARIFPGHNRRSRRLWSTKFLPVLLLGAFVGDAWAGMAIAPGDVLKVSVAEAPTIDHESRVDVDGNIVLPTLGLIAVAGRDLEAVRHRIADALVAQDLLKDPTVVVEIAAYRPVYVGGSVTQPGAITFEPGLTVRHALILAGGLDRTEDKAPMTIGELTELKAKWRTNNYELLLAKSRISRLQAELNSRATPDFTAIDKRLVQGKEADAVVQLETAVFDDRMTEQKREKAHIADLLTLFDLEIGVLSEQSRLEEQERALQEQQVAKTRELFEKGLVPLPRVQELEREASRLSRDLLDTRAYAARARQNRATQTYEAEAAVTNRRLELQTELRDRLRERAGLEAENEVLAAALVQTGFALTYNSVEVRPEPWVTIHRLIDGKTETVNAEMDTAIQPGDVLEVAIARTPQG